MPTYDYRCDACGHELELFQSMSESPRRKCPGCGKLKLRRLIGTGGGILFKGSGFYQTDYRSDSYKKGAEAEKPSADGAGKKADAGGSKAGDAPKKSGGDAAAAKD
jgi:putative FmdB family regulatory protein